MLRIRQSQPLCIVQDGQQGKILHTHVHEEREGPEDEMRELPERSLAGSVGAIFLVLLPFRLDLLERSEEGDDAEQHHNPDDDEQGLVQIHQTHCLDGLAGDGGDEHRGQSQGQRVADSHDGDALRSAVYGPEDGHVGIDCRLKDGVGGSADEAGQQVESETLHACGRDEQRERQCEHEETQRHGTLVSYLADDARSRETEHQEREESSRNHQIALGRCQVEIVFEERHEVTVDARGESHGEEHHAYECKRDQVLVAAHILIVEMILDKTFHGSLEDGSHLHSEFRHDLL